MKNKKKNGEPDDLEMLVGLLSLGAIGTAFLCAALAALVFAVRCAWGAAG